MHFALAGSDSFFFFFYYYNYYYFYFFTDSEDKLWKKIIMTDVYV